MESINITIRALFIYHLKQAVVELEQLNNFMTENKIEIDADFERLLDHSINEIRAILTTQQKRLQDVIQPRQSPNRVALSAVG
jgi:hypothetical protein